MLGLKLPQREISLNKLKKFTPVWVRCPHSTGARTTHLRGFRVPQLTNTLSRDGRFPFAQGGDIFDSVGIGSYLVAVQMDRNTAYHAEATRCRHKAEADMERRTDWIAEAERWEKRANRLADDSPFAYEFKDSRSVRKRD